MGDAGREDRLAGGHRADGPADLVLLGALDHVAAGARPHRREHGVLVVEHRQHQHRDVRAPSRAISRVAAEPVELRASAGPASPRPAAAGRPPSPRSRPSAATPTTSTSGSDRAGRPARRGRRGGRRPAPRGSESSRTHRDRPAGTRPGPARRVATDRRRRRRPARPPAPASPAGRRPGDHGAERGTVVADRHLEAGRRSAAGPRRWSAPRVAGDVGQRLGRHPVRGDLDRRGQRRHLGRHVQPNPTAAPSARQLSCSARCRRAPTRPSSSSAGGRRSSTTRRTSASAARVSRRSVVEQLARPGRGRSTRLAAASAVKAMPVRVGTEPVVQLAAQPAAFLLPRADQPLAGGLQLLGDHGGVDRHRQRRRERGRAPAGRRRLSRRSPSRRPTVEPADGLAAVGQRQRRPRRSGRWPSAASTVAVASPGRRTAAAGLSDRAGHAGQSGVRRRQLLAELGDDPGRVGPVAVHRPVDQPLQPRQERAPPAAPRSPWPGPTGPGSAEMTRSSTATSRRSRRSPPGRAAARPPPGRPPAGCRAAGGGRSRRSPPRESAGRRTAPRPACRRPGPRHSSARITTTMASSSQSSWRRAVSVPRRYRTTSATKASR